MLKKVFYAAVLMMAVAVSFTSCQKESNPDNIEIKSALGSPNPDFNSKIMMSNGIVRKNKLKTTLTPKNWIVGLATDAQKNTYKTLYVEYAGKKFYIMIENLRLTDIEAWRNVDNTGNFPNLTSTIAIHGYLYSINAAKKLQTKIYQNVNGVRKYGRLPNLSDIKTLFELNSLAETGGTERTLDVDLPEPKKNYYDAFTTGVDDHLFDPPLTPDLIRSLGGTRAYTNNMFLFSGLNEFGSFWINEQIIPGLYYHLYIKNEMIDSQGYMRQWPAWIWTWQNTGLAFSVRYVFDA